MTMEGKSMLRCFLLAVAVLTANLVDPHKPAAQERVRVGWAAMTASHTPLWVAQEQGFLAKQGLAVESIFFSAGPPAMQALVAGDLDIVVTSAPNVVNPRLGGAHGYDPVDHPDFHRPYRQHGEHHDHRTVTGENRFRQSFWQHLGDGVAAVVTPPGHRSGKGREDCACRRESRATRLDFEGHFSVYHHE